jgi:hypothetical protein
MARPLLSVPRTGIASRGFSSQEQRDRLEEVSREYAAAPAEVSDAALDALTDEAISQWRLQDGTFWQRVKFRSRMIRALNEGSGHQAPRRVNEKGS